MVVSFCIFIQLYGFLSILGIMLILCRSDGNSLLEEIDKAFYEGFGSGINTIAVYLFFAPFTIPYSIEHIIEKWKKN